MTKPLFSIIITTKNEEKNIENCLLSIIHQTFPKDLIEIIVVDNNSSDKTKIIAKRYTNKVFNKGPERSGQRNFGMLKKAKGKWLVYLDADMILSSCILKKLSEKIKKEDDVVGYYIPEIVLGNRYWNSVRRFERSFYDATPIDCVRVIKSDIFKKVNGFDLNLTGPEDWDLDKKIRAIGKTKLLDNYDFNLINRQLKKISILDIPKLIKITKKAVIFHNETKFSLKNYLSKKNYYAKSFENYINKWGRNDEDIKKQFGLWYRYFKVFYSKGFLFLIKNIDLLFGMFFIRGLVGFNYLRKK